MAKKTVATLQEGKKDGRSYTFSRTKVSIVYLLYTLSQLREGFLYLQIRK